MATFDISAKATTGHTVFGPVDGPIRMAENFVDIAVATNSTGLTGNAINVLPLGQGEFLLWAFATTVTASTTGSSAFGLSDSRASGSGAILPITTSATTAAGTTATGNVGQGVVPPQSSGAGFLQMVPGATPPANGQFVVYALIGLAFTDYAVGSKFVA